MPTILEMFGVPAPDEVRGRSLLPLLHADGKGHDAVLFGLFGGATNIADGRYTYFRYPIDLEAQELYEYTLMPAHSHDLFVQSEFEDARLIDSLPYQGLPGPAPAGHPNRPQWPRSRGLMCSFVRGCLSSGLS
jgi:hypothetical protein